jgi:hypothetical protein
MAGTRRPKSRSRSATETRRSLGARRQARAELSAKTADKHVLYERSVQDAQREVRFMQRVFKREHGRLAVSLREDFCGTALISATWVLSSAERRATGVDIDARVLAWSRAHHVATLGDAGRRLTLLEQDVRKPSRVRHDVICALNFSYWVFETRAKMRAYFVGVRRALSRPGLLVLDAYGGWASQEPMREPNSVDRLFTYVWEQHSFDPITHHVVNHIHFEFPDGSRLERAFTYRWRYWTPPELCELLTESGFSSVRVYWDTSDEREIEAYRTRAHAQNQRAWLAYIVAVP